MAISKKKRFEIFKRDDFTCAYCGKKPPGTVLEVDHVIPKSKEGVDEPENLITSCFDCNRGKGKHSLRIVPLKTAELMARAKELEDQVKEYCKILKVKRTREKSEIEAVDLIYKEAFPGWQLSDQFKRTSLKRFFSVLSLEEIEDAMEYAVSRIKVSGDAIKYFCGICWKKIREQSNG